MSEYRQTEAFVKRLATAKARAALMGAIVEYRPDLPDQPISVTRWGLTRQFSTLEQAEALLSLMGAPA